MKARQMLESHPDARAVPNLVECIEACLQCAQCCTACADACLAEEDPSKLARCINTDLDCADLCVATANILTRRTEADAEIINAQLHACVVACRVCADECDKHAKHHEHCRICGECCRMCGELCRGLVS